MLGKLERGVYLSKTKFLEFEIEVVRQTQYVGLNKFAS